jgi:hypothetical protein
MRRSTPRISRARPRRCARILEFAGKVVDIWNSRLAGGRELFLSPAIRAAIFARKPYLTFYCPACHVTGRVDLRKSEQQLRCRGI